MTMQPKNDVSGPFLHADDGYLNEANILTY